MYNVCFAKLVPDMSHIKGVEQLLPIYSICEKCFCITQKGCQYVTYKKFIVAHL